MKKRLLTLISVLLTISLMMGNMGMMAYAGEEKYYDPDSIPITIKQHSYGGVVDYDFFFEDGTEMDTSVDYMDNNPRGNTSVPTSYDARDFGKVTPVKNQGRGGTCWAFAAISTVESDCISKGYGTASTIDFSEDHHIWFTHKTCEAYGDGPVSLAENSDIEHSAYGGENWVGSGVSLTNWWGTELEENAPYDPNNLNNNGNLPESQRTVSNIHVQGATQLADTHNDVINNMTDIKNAVMEKGSCVIYYWADDKNSNSYYYYQNQNTNINHAVSIVGWDDNCSRSNFKSATGQQPAKNGAWLIKNSWGNHYTTKNGYFWLSYYDTSVNTAVTFDVEPVSNYDHVYGYNGFMPYVSSCLVATSLEYANVFTSPKEETLKAVGIWAMQDDLSYTIKVYRGLSSTAQKPTDGTLVDKCTTSGRALRKGYYTVKLKDDIDLSKNEKYAVVVSINAGSHSYLIYPFEGSRWSSTAFPVSYSSNKGESYIKRSSTWYDTKNYSSTTLNNALINTYTKDPMYFRLSPASANMQVGDTKTINYVSNISGLSCTVNDKEVSSFCTVSKVTNGFSIKANVKGSGNIYVTTKIDGKEYKATLPVTVTDPDSYELTGISVRTMPTKTTYNVGESFSQSGLTLTATYSNNTTKEIISGFTCSGFSSTTVGTKTVTVTYQGKTATFTVNVVKAVDGGITFSPSSVIIPEGKTVTVTVNYPKGGSFNPDESGTSSICSCGISYYGTSVELRLKGLNTGSGSLVCTSILDGVTYTGTLPITVEPILNKDDYSYIVNENGEAVITGYTGDETTLNIPGAIDGYIVTEIGERAIMDAGKEKAQVVIIPDSVKTIGRNAFTWCTVMESLTLPESLETIEGGAFSSCSSLKTVNIPSGVKTIGQQAFNDCTALQSVNFNIGSEKLTLGQYVFLNCTSLKTVDINSSNIEIGNKAFGYAYDFGTGTFGSTGLTIRGYADSPAYEYYQANSDTVNWALLSKELTGIEIKQNPTKTVYKINEPFDPSGMVVTAKYKDGSTETVTNSCTYTGFDSSKAGTKKVTVSYQGKTAILYISVVDYNNSPNIAVSTTSARPGQTATLDVIISNNPGINSFSLSFVYDTTALELVSVVPSENLGGSFNYYRRASWINSSDSTYNGTILTLTFEVKNSAEKKDYPVTVAYSTGDICNYNEDDVGFSITGGFIRVSDYIPGDINGDNDVNNKDLTRLLKYISGENVTVVTAALDVNGDKDINNKDLTRLLRYISGEAVEIH